MLNTIDEAAKVCKNEVRLVGTLTELTINLTKRNEQTVNVAYYGAVKVHDTFLRIYGNFTNNNTEFYQNVKRLESLSAYITCVVDARGVMSQAFNNVANKVYIIGKLLNNNSIRVEYISAAHKDEEYITFDIEGVPLGYERDKFKLLIITNNYHNFLEIATQTDGFNFDNHLVSLDITTNPYSSYDLSPIMCNGVHQLQSCISQDVINTALAEHELFIDSIEGIKTK